VCVKMTACGGNHAPVKNAEGSSHDSNSSKVSSNPAPDTAQLGMFEGSNASPGDSGDVIVHHGCLPRPLVYPRGIFGSAADEGGGLRLRCFRCGERIFVRFEGVRAHS
jgi:hypothetical protein